MKEDESSRMIVDSETGMEPTYEPRELPLSPEIRKRALEPAFLGEIPVPDGYAHVRGDCGDTMEVFLSIRDRRIHQARFDTLGCGFTLACGSMAMEMAQGKTVFEAMRIDENKIAEALGGLPSSHRHCAELASEALRKALRDFLSRGKDSWKRMYGPR